MNDEKKISELQWRRNWNKTIYVVPWKVIKVSDEMYLVKFLCKIDSYEILWTDLNTIWNETLHREAILSRSQDLNPSIEAPLSKICDHISECLQSNDQSLTFLKTSNYESPTDIVLHMTSTLADVTFNWKFFAKVESHNVFAEHVTIPLSMMVGELMRRQQELISQLKAKDRQIEDYKLQGAKPTRKHYDTARFEEVAFTNNMDTDQGLEMVVLNQGREAFASAASDLYNIMMTKYAYLTYSPEGDAEEAGIGATDGCQSPSGVSFQSWGNRLPPSLLSSFPTRISPEKSPIKAQEHLSPTHYKDSHLQEYEIERRRALDRKFEEKSKEEHNSKKKKRTIPF